MEILQFILNFFLKEYGGEELKEVFNSLLKNGFDLKKTLSSITPDKIIPIIGAFLNKQTKSPTDTVGQDYKLQPVSNIADGQILSLLEGYLG